MQDIDVEVEGELRINPIKYEKIITKIVAPHNSTSGKIYLSHEYVSRKVIVLIPKSKSQKR